MPPRRNNDSEYGEFDSYLEDEYGFDAHYPPGIESLGAADSEAASREFNQGPLELQRDNGSGSRAEDGQQEILEDRMDSEIGQYSEDGASEIGDSYLEHQYEIGSGAAADRPGSEIGVSGFIAQDGPSEIGNYAEEGASEVGNYAENGASEVGVSGFIAQDGPSEIGNYAESGASEVGSYAEQGASEVGQYSEDGPSEIGEEYIQAPFESFMLEDARMGDDEDFEIGAQAAADRPGSEIVGAAVLKVIEKARDNRRPAPPMKALSVDAPFEEDEWSLSDVTIGAAVATGDDQFPLLNDFLLRAGAAVEPRIVRIDTEESYKRFRTENSPELSEFREMLDAHMNDPRAHEGGRREEGLDDDLSDDVDELVHLGAEAAAAEDSKRIPLYAPKHFDGLIDAWRDGDNVCASMQLPAPNGGVLIGTSVEPVDKCVEEISRHAAESGVSIGEIVDSLPAMGCTLGAATALKEMAAGAPAILSRPEARSGQESFVVRLEPKVNPNTAALAMLAFACRAGNAQACDEWKRLAAGCPNVVKQAMAEAQQLVLAAA